MNYTLSNQYLMVNIKSEGAEITSVKSNEGIEYMWCGDKKYWGRHAPILFPIVGRVLENEYTVEGKAYQITQHGFARDCDFSVLYHEPHAIAFGLSANEETKEKYPFEFELRIIYTLEERTIAIKYEVINKDERKMHFAIGAHPAFNCPLFEGETLKDYYIEFEQQEEASKLLTTPEVYLSGEKEKFCGKEIALSKAFFKDDAVILTDIKSSWMAIKSNKNDHSIVVSSKAFPFTGIWSPVGGAPFICIEPWIGHTDYASNSRELAEKKDMISLEPAGHFSAQYEISFN